MKSSNIHILKINMTNNIYIEGFKSKDDPILKLPLESFITYVIYKCCKPVRIDLVCLNLSEFTIRAKNENIITIDSDEHVCFTEEMNVPWQISSCMLPAVCFEDTVITGLCGVARHICKYTDLSLCREVHEEGLLGFRKSCLQAPNETSIWTKFCEVDIIKTVKDVLRREVLTEIPKNLLRFENHLQKPVRLHNAHKIARELKKENYKIIKEKTPGEIPNDNRENPEECSRIPKSRKWKSNLQKKIEINCSMKLDDLGLSHEFAEGPFLTLADLILIPLYYLYKQRLGETHFKHFLPYTWKWYNNIINIIELQDLKMLLEKVSIESLKINSELLLPEIDDVSLYKCDPKRHNPKKKLYTKEDDVLRALNAVSVGMLLEQSENNFCLEINWNEIPDGANPNAGHLPDQRMLRKSEQLENLALAVLSIAQDGDVIVDFCSGSGHLGILVAHLLPSCTVILLENKEQSLFRARKRVHDMDLKNVYFFHCNLDFYIGEFNIGIALHACGIASDLVLDKCLKARAKFVICPCCYGSLHVTDRLIYPRSNKFSKIPIDQYLCIGHAADQTHDEHPLTVRGSKCMAVIDSDRAHLAKEHGYEVSLTRLKPLSCTPKNNLLIGVPT